MKIKSFVFLDLETTGLPAFECNKTKIIELCLISVQAEHICLGVMPRVQNKINLCFNPQKSIQAVAQQITGLYNDDLDNESSFNDISLSLIKNFLARLSKPICFVAHNGFKFDYPILRNHIESIGKDFPTDILCMDSLTAFRQLHELETKENHPKTTDKPPETIASASDGFTDDWDDILFEEVLKIEKSLCDTLPKNDGNITGAQCSNETTPPVKKLCNIPAAPRHGRIRKSGDLPNENGKSSAQRKLDFGGKSGKEAKPSFKLSSCYERFVRKEALNAHQAEVDVTMLLECAVHLGDIFVDYANENAVLFNDIPKMEPGKKVGMTV